jgi:hypothetical protein
MEKMKTLVRQALQLQGGGGCTRADPTNFVASLPALKEKEANCFENILACACY